jgi:hypothetical protein
MTVHMMNRATVHRQVTAEIRAEMGRQQLAVNRLPQLLGRSQTYWQRRINGDQIVLDIDDLYALAELLKVPVSQFYEAVHSEDPHPIPDGGSDKGRGQPTR